MKIISTHTPKSQTDIPVLFLIFNRPEITLQSLSCIQAVKPTQLFIAADGPRHDKDGEAELCERTRQLVIESINWDCEVKTLFRNQNLGCRTAVAEAITWFFNHVEEGIIIEDDCMIAQSFFEFAQEMLEKYRDNTKILSISAHCHISKKIRPKESYFFSKYQTVWGWATWRRAWNLYPSTVDRIPEFFEKGGLKQLNDGCSVFEHHYKKFWAENESGKIDTWDIVWGMTGWVNGMLKIIPSVNMSRNIGWGANSTHTSESESWQSKIDFENFNFPIIHPKIISRNTEIDKWIDIHINHITPLQPVIHFFSRITLLRKIYHSIIHYINNRQP